MSKGSEAVKRWRHATKKRMVDAFGDKCCVCDYNACDDALTFHHLDPAEKDYTISQMLRNIKSWKQIVEELRKCVLVCNRCHSEVHSSRIDTHVPNDAPRFDEQYLDYKALKKQLLTE